MDLCEQSRLAVAGEVTWQTVGADTVVLSLESGYIYTCNATTARMLERLDGRGTLGELADAMEAEFDAPREEVLRDVLSMARQLVEEKLLRAVE